MALSAVASAQTAGPPNQQPAQGAYTLQAHVREVITDVTVTDRHGNPVAGLPESAFRISDNGKLQRVVNFQEHNSGESSPILESSANVFNNDLALHPPAVFNVVMLDTATIPMTSQMYLRRELDRFVNGLPATEPVAIFVRSSEHVVMVANFTADHEKLLGAMHTVLPRLRIPGWQYATDMSLLQELCGYLEQYPGRKNVLWFNGGSNLMLRSDPGSMNTAYVDLRPIYDALERGRVALYPIDARGLGESHIQQDMLMEEEATATGGHAIFNNNGLALAARHIADTDGSYYTLTYSPQDVKLDNKWHVVKVDLAEGNYQMSYRRGYYDDGSNLKQNGAPGRKQLLASGDVIPDVHMQPINFQVSVTPASAGMPLQPSVVRTSTEPPHKGERAYTLRYSVPMDDFPQTTQGDQSQFTLGLGLFAFNQYGRPFAKVADRVKLSISQERIVSAAHANISFDQVINLPDGNDFLYVAVWNMQSGRMGVVQIPLAVEKARLR